MPNLWVLHVSQHLSPMIQTTLDVFLTSLAPRHRRGESKAAGVTSTQLLVSLVEIWFSGQVAMLALWCFCSTWNPPDNFQFFVCSSKNLSFPTKKKHRRIIPPCFFPNWATLAPVIGAAAAACAASSVCAAACTPSTSAAIISTAITLRAVFCYDCFYYNFCNYLFNLKIEKNVFRIPKQYNCHKNHNQKNLKNHCISYK